MRYYRRRERELFPEGSLQKYAWGHRPLTAIDVFMSFSLTENIFLTYVKNY